jgi:hypothetical protein
MKCKAKGAAKKEQKENTFFRIAKGVFFILTPPTSLVHTLSFFVQIE